MQVRDAFGRVDSLRLLAEAARDVAVPDLPVMPVAVFHAGIIAAAVGTAGPIRCLAVEFGYDLRQNLMIVERTRHRVIRLIPIALLMNPLVLIVAAPQGHTGMAAQAFDLIARLSFDFGHKFRIVFGVHGAGEHEILPDQQAQAVAERIEDVVLIDAAAPDADHVHVGVLRGPKQHFIAFIGDGPNKGISGDPVTATRKDRDAIEYEAEEARAPFFGVWRLIERQRADADL